MNYLIYSSQRTPDCSKSEIQAILASCKKNNPKLDITGVLLHSDNYFLQYLEGTESDIMDLYYRIKEDSRHHSVILLSKGSIQERNFPSWHMGFKDLDSKEMKFDTQANSSEVSIFNSLLKGEVSETNEPKALNVLTKFYKMI